MHVAIIEPLGVAEDLVRQLMGSWQGTYEYYTQRTTDQEELAQRTKDADAIVVANAPVSATVLAASPKLKLVSVAFTGLDHVDLDYCTEHDIAVTNCAGYATNAVAEEVFGLAIGLLRQLAACDRRTRAGADKTGLAFGELHGRTLGVVGNGAIAKRVIQLGQAFGMPVLCWARTQRPIDGVRYVTLDELCTKADVLTLHVPLVPQTRHLIDARRLSLMKPTALLINTARGPVVDNDALAKALTSGALAGAGLDVFDDEPPLDPNTPVLHAPNTLLAPHIGFATQEALDARARMAIAHLQRLS